jgi:hypothetical protein
VARIKASAAKHQLINQRSQVCKDVVGERLPTEASVKAEIDQGAFKV